MNGFEKFFATIGHDVKVVFVDSEKLLTNLPKYIKTATDAGREIEEIVPLVQNVIGAAMNFAKPAVAIGSAFASAGGNLTLDITALKAVETELPTFKKDVETFALAIKALAEAIGADWQELMADLEVTS